MPLSEEEQRILQQIEQGFYANDPRSAERIETTTLPRYLARNLRWAAGAFLLGLVVLIASFVTSWVLAVVGLALMLAGAVAFTQNLRKMGRHSWQQMSQALHSKDISGSLDDARERLRRRFGPF